MELHQPISPSCIHYLLDLKLLTVGIHLTQTIETFSSLLFRIQFLIFKWTIKSTLKHFLILVTKMGHLEDFSLHSQKDLNSGCLTVSVVLSLKKSPPKIYKLNCLTKICTGHSVLASYRLSRKFEVYIQNKKPVRKQNRKTTNRIK